MGCMKRDERLGNCPAKGCKVYLKQVDMENFKSFGGKISIPLMEGYMAITGPNGSGKSNITDAILFVLGPRSSKAMRAGKLTDLIYNGNKTSGKADFMKVSLIFDNSDRMLPWDADEVKITRTVKVSKSNSANYSSDYYINDQKCNQGEIESLLTRARISADGYNMVQQGDVTDITKMGNIDRRRVLDSISGIASYDADITKAENEKAAAKENMERIQIVIDELDKQLKQLKEQMEAARKHIETKKRLDMANAQMVHRQLFNEEEKLKYTRENYQKTSDEIEELKKKKEELVIKIAELEQAKKDKEQEIADRVGPEYLELKNKIENVKLEKARATDAIDRESERKQESENELAGLNENLVDADAELSNCITSITNTEITYNSKKDELNAAKEENERISEEMKSIGGEHTELENRLSEIEQSIDTKGNEEHEIRAKATTAAALEEETSRAVASLEEKIGSVDFEIKDSEWNLSKIKEEAGPAADVTTFTNRILAMKKQEGELEKQEGELNDAIRRISEDYNRLLAEKKVSERMSRGSDAVLAVLEMRDKGQIRGIHGTIAELASVDPQFETALSIAAGGKMQAIIVDDDEVAASAIDALKKGGFGRATFLPLSKMMEGKPRAKAIMIVKQSLGYAIDLIDFKPEYRAAFWYVFGDTIVVDSLSDARRLMGGVRLVTKSGELLEASGAMTGGTLKGAATIKFGAASQSQLDKVSSELRAANTSLDTLKGQLVELRGQIREADNQMRSAGAGNIELQGKITKFEVQLKELRESKKRATAELQEKKTALADAQKEKEKLTADLAAATKELEDLKAERGKIRARISEIAPAEMQQRIQDARDAVYNLSGEVSELVNVLAALKAERSGYENNKQSIQNDITRLNNSIEENVKKITEAAEKEKRAELDLSALRKIESEMESGIKDLREEKDKILENKLKAENSRDNATTSIESKSGILLSIEAQINIVNTSIEELKQRVSEIKVQVEEPIPSEEELKRTIRSCESIIEKLGNVNLRAIEDYDEKKARYDTLTTDVEKLNSQIKDLSELTASLTSTKKGLFMEVYDGVNANFKAIFAELSGGGEAYMSLEDEEDPFSGGLMINAKPKNGKLLRLEALSGGEKSLTALAFIFAIQEHQPSPFYVLDEVDMFLDSVNSEMVAVRIKKSSAKTQFIQVSLRKVTLAMADHLIGVTRPPNGLSKVIMQPNLEEVSKYEEEANRKMKAAETKEKDGIE